MEEQSERGDALKVRRLSLEADDPPSRPLGRASAPNITPRLARQFSGLFGNEQTLDQHSDLRTASLFHCLDVNGLGILKKDAQDLARSLVHVAVENCHAETDNILDKARGEDGNITTDSFFKAVNEHQSEEVASEIDAVIGSWFREDKWRTKIQYTKLLLPILHLILVSILTVDRYSEHWNLRKRSDQLVQWSNGTLDFIARPMLRVVDEYSDWASICILVVISSVVCLLVAFPFRFQTAQKKAALLNSRSTHRSAVPPPETRKLIGDLLRDAQGDWTDDAFESFNLHNSLIAKNLKMVARVQNSLRCAVLGLIYVSILVLPDASTQLYGQSGVKLPIKRSIDALQAVYDSLLLVQYWAYCLVIFIATFSSACTLSPAYQKSIEMDKCMLSVYRFQVPECPSAPTAKTVYNWLLRAQLPLAFEPSRVFWDYVKRYFFTPFCVYYALLPLAYTLWHPQWISGSLLGLRIFVSIVLIAPNLTAAFIYQSYMLHAATIVRQKMYAVKGLTYMLSPLGAMMVGLPCVNFNHPKTLVAWLKITQFVGASFQAKQMVAVDISFKATGALIVILQILLYRAVSMRDWTHGLVFLFFYLVCLTYGFGTLGVALNTEREHKVQARRLEQMRVEFVQQCYLSWSDECGRTGQRTLNKDMAVQMKDVIRSVGKSGIHSAGIDLTTVSLFLLRGFMTTMLTATLVKLPIVMSIWDAIIAHPALKSVEPANRWFMPVLNMFGSFF